MHTLVTLDGGVVEVYTRRHLDGIVRSFCYRQTPTPARQPPACLDVKAHPKEVTVDQAHEWATDEQSCARAATKHKRGNKNRSAAARSLLGFNMDVDR